MAKYRKKPEVIDTIQFTGDNGQEIHSWSNGVVVESPVLEPTAFNPTGVYLQIITLKSMMIAIVNDWIVKGIIGNFYPIKDEIFKQMYEKM